MSFKSYLTEAEANTHMTHVEDLVFISGVEGTKQAVNYLRDMRSLFHKKQKNKYSVKFDGAPAVVCGIDPADGRFFVAKKGLFNKTPKLYKTKAEIDADLEGGLNDIFTELLQYLPPLGFKGIVQGDLMFRSSTLQRETIDGEQMIMFHPNTIAYAVPINSELGKKIERAKIGIVFHTTYSGNSFANLRASFGKDIAKKLRPSADVWAIDATLKDASNDFALSDEEYMHTEFLLKDIGVQFQRIPAQLLNSISKDEELKALVLVYINSLVRANKKVPPLQMANGFHDFIEARYNKEMESKKSDKGKAAVADKKVRALEFYRLYTVEQIATIFELASDIAELKNILLSKMRKIAGLSHYLKTADGFKVTNPEGFVGINSTDGNAVKLVDRAEFSHANFNPEIQKGWQR